MGRRAALTAAGLIAASCSTGAPDISTELVPITVIAESNSANLMVTMLTSDCVEDLTEVRVSEAGGEVVSIAVRYGATSCDDVETFSDLNIRLDGPLGQRSLELTQPPDSEQMVGSDVCIIDGATNRERCTVVIGE